jgi:hypothetical protein
MAPPQFLITDLLITHYFSLSGRKSKKAWDLPGFSQYPLVRFALTVVLLVAAQIGAALADSSQDQVNRLIAAARGQIGVTRYYDPTYTVIAYPNGDVPLDRAFAPTF